MKEEGLSNFRLVSLAGDEDLYIFALGSSLCFPVELSRHILPNLIVSFQEFLVVVPRLNMHHPALHLHH